MKKLLLSILTFTFGHLNSQPCTPGAQNFAETPFIRTGLTTMGDLWTEKSLTSGGLEYPKRTSQEMVNGIRAISPIFAGGIWLSAKNGSQLKVSAMSYRTPINKAHFFPGPIRLSDASVHPQSCTVFDKIWRVQKLDIKTHINNWASGALPILNIPTEISDWPAKGNKKFTTVPITDDMAPFADVNGNGIYDPEYGDYPIIKGDESFFAVFNDISSGRLDSIEKPIGVEVHLMTSTFNDFRLNSFGTALFQDCRIIKKTPNDVSEFILGLYVDSDLGNFNDDYIGCDTASNTGYTYNGDNFDENAGSVRGYLDNPPIAITSFINAKMGSFTFHRNGSNQSLSNPNNSVEYRNFMEGKTRTGTNFSVSADALGLGSPITKFCFLGNPSSASEWSMASQNYTLADLRYNMSTEMSTLSYNQPKEISFITYFHKFATSSFKPNIRDSVIPNLTKIKNYYRDSINKCNINITAQITADTNGLKKGKVTVTSISGAAAPYNVRWSSNETTESITGKDSGTYRLAVVDAKQCMYSKSFYIPRIKKGTVSIFSNSAADISIYPNPAKDLLFVTSSETRSLTSTVIPAPASAPLSFGEAGRGITLTNLLGQSFSPPVIPASTIIPANLSGSQHHEAGLSIDVRSLPEGIYLLQIRDKNDNSIKMERIVIQRDQ
ncbi:MAG: T9SS type A sorting domain-containing protein [Chitinophagales bacterium]